MNEKEWKIIIKDSLMKKIKKFSDQNKPNEKERLEFTIRQFAKLLNNMPRKIKEFINKENEKILSNLDIDIINKKIKGDAQIVRKSEKREILEAISDIGFKINELDQKISNLDQKVNQLDEKVTRLDEKVNQLDEKVNKLDEKVNKLDEKVNKLDEKVNQLDEKVNRLDEKVNQLDEKVNKLDEKVNKLDEKVNQLDEKVNQLDEKVNKLDEKVEQLVIGVNNFIDISNRNFKVIGEKLNIEMEVVPNIKIE